MDILAIDFTLPRRTFDVRVALSLGAETVALVGPSGSGKTSLLRTIAGLERPHAGRITLGDDVWLDAGRGIHLSAERRRVGFLPQDYGLFPHLTIAGNVRFAARRDRPDLLDRLGIGHLAAARPPELSGGERQRAALARALAREPRVLLLDEPFGSLDAVTRQRVRDELADLLGGLQLPTLVVTHAFEDAIALADRVGVIDRGRMLQLAPATEILHDPASVTVAALTGANVLHGRAEASPAGSTVHLDGGGELSSSTPVEGRVEVIVQPWALELTDPESSPLVDTVLGVRQDRGTLVIRLTRCTVHVSVALNGGEPIALGSLVGLRAAPSNVSVLPAAPGSTVAGGGASA